MNEQARRHTPPKRVRFTTDRQFASSCSPPRLAATQLLSATGLWPTPTRTRTALIRAIVGALDPGVRRDDGRERPQDVTPAKAGAHCGLKRRVTH